MTLAQGIDVSRYQPTIDWQRVADSGISFAFIKASQANFGDPLFGKHWAGAKAAKLLRGAYHYLVPDLDGAKQAAVFLKFLDKDPGELPPVLDIEAKTTNPAQYAAYAETWLKNVEDALQRRPIIYTAAWYWNTTMLIGGKYPAWAPNYPLWVAHYPLKEGFPPLTDIEDGKYKPAMPKSWTSWTFWQYTERGRVDGIATNGRPANVDLNVFQSSLEDLLDWSGANPEEVVVLPPVDATLATNIQIIQAFHKVFGNESGVMLSRAGLMPLVTGDPTARYNGPAIAEMVALTPTQKLALTKALADVVGGG
ncbi:MAG: GH25 family lysozyme [Anaerolineales bacterium]|nr:GH25 family lysozyme [Anaerolineales bacterium]